MVASLKKDLEKERSMDSRLYVQL